MTQVNAAVAQALPLALPLALLQLPRLRSLWQRATWESTPTPASARRSIQSVWAGGERRALDEARARFAVAEGDLVAYLNVWRGWEESGCNKKWSYANHISHRGMLRRAARGGRGAGAGQGRG